MTGTEYENQVETKLNYISTELEKVYNILDASCDLRERMILEQHRRMYLSMIKAYRMYIDELKKNYGNKLTELPKPKKPSSKYGGNS